MLEFSTMRPIGIAGQGRAGKDTLYEQVLKPRGFIRWQMTLHYKTWLVATGRGSLEDVFLTKPLYMRKILQDEVTSYRYEWGETIWFEVFKAWMISLHEIVGVDVSRVAISDLRFLIELQSVKSLGGKIIHMKAPDQQANIAPELRRHRSETELDSPLVARLRDGYIYNSKLGVRDLIEQGETILWRWGWL